MASGEGLEQPVRSSLGSVDRSPVNRRMKIGWVQNPFDPLYKQTLLLRLPLPLPAGIDIDSDIDSGCPGCTDDRYLLVVYTVVGADACILLSDIAILIRLDWFRSCSYRSWFVGFVVGM